MTIRAYAVVCANGEIHERRDVPHAPSMSMLKEWALNEAMFLDMTPAPYCSPHKVITLRGEVSLARRSA